MKFSLGRETVRTFCTTILTGLILACPFLCGAVEAVEGAHHQHAGTATEGPAPAHCPEDSDNCICRGAVQAGDVKLPDIDPDGLPLPLHGLVGLLAHSPTRTLAHLTCDGSPTGLAGWGDSIAIRALLQNFRC